MSEDIKSLQRVVDKAGQAVDVGRKLSKALDQMEHGLGGSALLRAVGNWIDMHVKQMALIRDIKVSKLVKHVLTPEEGAEVKEIASKLRAEQWARREAEYALNLARVELASLAINNRGHVDDEKPISALAAENKALRAALRNARRQIDDMTRTPRRRHERLVSSYRFRSAPHGRCETRSVSDRSGERSINHTYRRMRR
jgi:hypothetical protein